VVETWGRALAAGLVRSGHWKPSQITVTDVRPAQLSRLRLRYRVNTNADNRRAIRGADIILLAIKPQQMTPVLEDLGPVIRKSQLVLSIAAGIPTRRIEKILSRSVPVIRIMPNTPALVGQGMSALALGRAAKQSHARLARAILETVGEVVTVPERQMDAVTAVSGSGPAYVFYLAEAMRDAALNWAWRRRSPISWFARRSRDRALFWRSRMSKRVPFVSG